MKHFILAVHIDKSHDYCIIVREEQALEILRCMFEIGVDASLEYADLEGTPKEAPAFDWISFVYHYRQLVH